MSDIKISNYICLLLTLIVLHFVDSPFHFTLTTVPTHACNKKKLGTVAKDICKRYMT